MPFPHYLNITDDMPVIDGGGSKGVSEIFYDRASSGASGLWAVNGQAFGGWDHPELFLDDLCVNKVYRMEIGGWGGRGYRHPSHMHVQPHLIESMPSGTPENVNILRVGEWRDTYPAFGAKVLLPTFDYAYFYVIHCHVLQHEDTGMINAFLVKDCDGTALNGEVMNLLPEELRGGQEGHAGREDVPTGNRGARHGGTVRGAAGRARRPRE